MLTVGFCIIETATNVEIGLYQHIRQSRKLLFTVNHVGGQINGTALNMQWIMIGADHF